MVTKVKVDIFLNVKWGAEPTPSGLALLLSVHLPWAECVERSRFPTQAIVFELTETAHVTLKVLRLPSRG